MQDLKNKVDYQIAMTAAVKTADDNGDSVDLQNNDSCTITAVVGASGDTLSGSVYIELELEESTDNSTWTDCADADVQGSVTGTNTGTFAVIDDAAEDDAIYTAGYLGDARYVRMVANVTGTHTNGTPIGAVAVMGNPRKA
jgi:hypothetical protein